MFVPKNQDKQYKEKVNKRTESKVPLEETDAFKALDDKEKDYIIGIDKHFSPDRKHLI